MSRSVISREFSAEQLFAGMETGFNWARQIVENEGRAADLSETVRTGSETIPYDTEGEFGIEISDAASAALLQRHRLKEETAAMREHLHSEEKKLLRSVFGAVVRIDADYLDFGERAWGVGYRSSLTTTNPVLQKVRLEGDVEGVIIDVNIWKSIIEMESRRFSMNRLRRVEVPILDRYGRRCARFTPIPQQTNVKISYKAIEEARRKLQLTKAALLRQV